MDYKITGYEPAQLFHFFEEVSAIPRGSGNEKGISDFLVAFAKERGLDVYQDEVYNVIIRPVVSERSFDLMNQNKYTFEVAKDANKYQIKDAVEEIFGVKVVRVNTLTVKPKTKRVRYVAGKTRSWKKAIVTLAEGDTIEVFGNQA